MPQNDLEDRFINALDSVCIQTCGVSNPNPTTGKLCDIEQVTGLGGGGVSVAQFPHLYRWFSKYGPQTNSIHTNWALVSRANSPAPPRLPKSDRLGGGAQHWCFIKRSLRLEQHGVRI